jgi:hypothetical protein
MDFVGAIVSDDNTPVNHIQSDVQRSTLTNAEVSKRSGH